MSKIINWVALTTVLIAVAWSAHRTVQFLQSLPRCGVSINPELSPSGGWVAEKVDYCTNDGLDPYSLSIRPATEAIGGPRALLFHIYAPDSVYYKWLDGEHLIVGSNDLKNIPTRPDHIANVSIDFKTYFTNKPDETQDKALKSVIIRKALPIYSFEPESGEGLSLSSCSFQVDLDGGPMLKRVSIRLTESGISFFGYADRSKPVNFVTAAGFGDGRSGEPQKDFSLLRFDDQRSISLGESSPAWRMDWSLNRNQLVDLIDNIRSRHFDVKMGFWFESTEVIYSIDGPAESNQIEKFYSCIRPGAPGGSG